jgi:U5 small nuclear ribonucleoprotein component
VLLPDSRGKNYLINVVDTPGHPGFSDEVTVGMRLADSIILVVDVIEGVTMTVEWLIKQAVKQSIPIVVFINKLDRLVLELKLPPCDAYFKIKSVLDELNMVIHKFESVH